ncbi:MAG TPA: peptidyl-tRNA hydrolase, partial [Solirubrobacteraceae bacterium]|nr:peptidyl-tRNA hydrolase [Solirubrobacteraceae bacterium]
SARGPLLERLQAMSSALAAPPERAGAGRADGRPGALTYVLNPAAVMSSGKTVAQIAHAAVMAAGEPRLAAWVARGCRARVLAPAAPAFAAAAAAADCVARVVDAGLTEVPPGTVTVVALAPGAVADLPPALR